MRFMWKYERLTAVYYNRKERMARYAVREPAKAERHKPETEAGMWVVPRKWKRDFHYYFVPSIYAGDFFVPVNPQKSTNPQSLSAALRFRTGRSLL